MLEAAYDDARGVTAAFNLNLLHRINRELGADFERRILHAPGHLPPGSGQGRDPTWSAPASRPSTSRPPT